MHTVKISEEIHGVEVIAEADFIVRDNDVIVHSLYVNGEDWWLKLRGNDLDWWYAKVETEARLQKRRDTLC